MSTPSAIVPFHRPSIGEEEIREVTDVLRSGWLTTGPKTAQFEAEFGKYVDSPHSLALSSGTAGLHLALAALGIGPGDEVITTPLTFCATVNTILQVGATPVLADVGTDLNIDPESVADRITERTRAIMPVHLGGLPCRMDELWEIARRHGLVVVEDAAHAVGTQYCGSPIGGGSTLSDAIVFSFYATKNLTTGEGGMVTCRDAHLAASMRLLSLHGISKDAWNRYDEKGNWFYQVEACGFKYNLSDIQSAIGIHQLRKQEEWLAVRTRNARLYNELLSDLPEIEIPPDSSDARHSWHLYPLRLNLNLLAITRDEFIARLRSRGIIASVHFIPIPMHPYFRAHANLARNACPAAIELYPRLVSLPLYPALSEEQVRYVCEAVTEIARSARRQTAFAATAGGHR